MRYYASHIIGRGNLERGIFPPSPRLELLVALESAAVRGTQGKGDGLSGGRGLGYDGLEQRVRSTWGL